MRSFTISSNFEYTSQTASRAKIKYLEPRLSVTKASGRSLANFAGFLLSQNLLDRVYAEQVGGSALKLQPEALFYADFFSISPTKISSNFFGSSLKNL